MSTLCHGALCNCQVATPNPCSSGSQTSPLPFNCDRTNRNSPRSEIPTGPCGGTSSLNLGGRFGGDEGLESNRSLTKKNIRMVRWRARLRCRMEEEFLPFGLECRFQHLDQRDSELECLDLRVMERSLSAGDPPTSPSKARRLSVFYSLYHFKYDEREAETTSSCDTFAIRMHLSCFGKLSRVSCRKQFCTQPD